MLKLYNSLTAKTTIFKPLRGKEVKIYACGPTVYDFAHIGNLRTYIFEDVLRRTLEYNGYKIKQAMNITDIDDKIIKKAEEKNKNFKKIAEPFAKAFFKDIKKLNIEKAEFYPKAAAHIGEIINLVGKLLKKKSLITAPTVRFISTFPNSKIMANFPVSKKRNQNRRQNSGRRIQQRRSAGFRFVESEKKRRTELAVAVGGRPAGLAH